ncbi:hypothetical protein [Kitasatospora phosalacinea]|nr:hypothetical protein [Kitasatospora phosalacinea]
MTVHARPVAAIRAAETMTGLLARAGRRRLVQRGDEAVAFREEAVAVRE